MAERASDAVQPEGAVGALAGHDMVAAGGTTNAATVKLLIKASNQQYDDQVIESDLQWTVRRLKKQLSMVYPSKPLISDQKLIYSGQLLNDAQLLKDVIRNYKDVQTQNHIFHLVCAFKNAPTSSKLKPFADIKANRAGCTAHRSPSGEGLRRRTTANGVQLPQEQQLPSGQEPQQSGGVVGGAFDPNTIPQLVTSSGRFTSQCPSFSASNPPTAMPFSFPGQSHVQLANQQVAMYNWMRQVYSQYMEHCMRISVLRPEVGAALQQLSPADTATASIMTPQNGQLASNAFVQQMPFASAATAIGGTLGGSYLNAGIANPLLTFSNQANIEAVAAAATSPPLSPPVQTPQSGVVEPAAGTGDVAAGVEQRAAEPPPQRFPNIAQDEENEDWLDNFFALTRLAIFLTILVFNTSPLRCFSVILIAGGIYLYHIGFFRANGERNNNNINRNNNAANGANQIRQGVEAVQQAQQQQQEQAQHDAADATEAAAPPEASDADEVSSDGSGIAEPLSTAATRFTHNMSTAAFIRVFMVSFFTSLLPDMPAQ